ncbi:hypothetical protein RHGRI_029175 [Rhododendron griersonianum]|uniref:Uncharacterized protein n=1 Tax=Rhododendron griersonianum TaxID=479676 RepID=A0AAV6IKK4_9ERIC|nr:hypothetical protein RHGRI_029175 [Rhododendron griersonianum]
MKANNGLAVKTPMNPMTGIQKSWKDVLVSPAPAYWKAPERKLLAVSPEVPAYWKAPERKLLAVLPEVPAHRRLQSESSWPSYRELKQTIALRYSKRLKASKE